MPETILPAEERPYVQVNADPGEQLGAIDHDQVWELYQHHGALLFRGFMGSLDEFHSFARGFCPVAVLNESRNRASLGQGQDVQTVNLGTRPFPLHPELSREPWKPDTAFFYCLTPPTRGGATTLCDGVAIVRALPEELRQQMSGRRLKYILPTNPKLLEFWLGTPNPTAEQLASPPSTCPYRFEWTGQQLVRTFTRPLLHRPMFSDELAFGNFLLFARYLRGVLNFPLLEDGSIVPGEWVEAVKLASDPLTVPIEWQQGDLVMVDNSRFMHGRTEIVPEDKRLIATYFGYLRDATPNPEEPADPVWRKPGFIPPATGL